MDTIRKMGPPPGRAPPPKMRDLFIPPQAPTTVNHLRSASVESSASGGVRHVTPEDVYDDRNKQQSHHLNQGGYSSSAHQDELFAHSYQHQPTPGGRQISNTSAATTAVSGSENWETYDDASEPEPDASEAYYAKLRAARIKRENPYDGYAPQQGTLKRQKGIPPLSHAGHVVMDAEGNRIVSGSDANWTDEDAFWSVATFFLLIFALSGRYQRLWHD
jgi:protein regulator of cytokinesis 1